MSCSKIECFCHEKLLLTLKPYILGKCKDGIGFLGYKITCKDVDLLQKSKKRKKQKLRRINYEFENYFISETKYIERVKCLFSVWFFYALSLRAWKKMSLRAKRSNPGSERWLMDCHDLKVSQWQIINIQFVIGRLRSCSFR